MALTALTRFDTIEHVSDMDPCKKWVDVPVDPENPTGPTRKEVLIEEGATIFEIGPLDLFIMGKIYDSGSKILHSAGSDEAAVATFANQTNIEAVQFGLRGWKNFKDAKGNDLAFKTQKRNVNGRSYEIASDESMKALGMQLAGELGFKIKQISEVTASEAKN